MRVLEDALLPLDQQLDDEAVQLVHSVVERVVEMVVETVVRRGFKLIFDELLILEYCPVNYSSGLILISSFLLTKVIVHPSLQSDEDPFRRLSISVSVSGIV